jgi:hypothetical protein
MIPDVVFSRESTLPIIISDGNGGIQANIHDGKRARNKRNNFVIEIVRFI